VLDKKEQRVSERRKQIPNRNNKNV